MRHYEEEDRGAVPLALGLGWFSIGLGLAELAAPRSVARLIGIQPTERTDALLRSFGAREIASGIAILRQPDDARWLWARVAGDALDLGALGAAMADAGADRTRGAVAAAAVMGATALDVVCAQRLQRGPHDDSRHVRVEQAVTINRSLEDVFRYWHDFQNFPSFMRHLESVEVLGNGRTRWRAKAPAGTTVEWEAETVVDRENEWIAWQSIEGSQIENSGSVRFQRAPGARGTEVRVQLEYHPPAGVIGRAVAWMFGEEPSQQVKDDLRRFKQLMETGEIPVSDGPSMWRPARPAESAPGDRLAGAQEVRR